MNIKRFTFGLFETNTYVISDDTGYVMLIDPACYHAHERQELYDYITERLGQQDGLTILATHGHLDHLWGAAWACGQWHCPVLMNEADRPLAESMQMQYDLFGIRKPVEPFPMESLMRHRLPCSVIRTPGHTPGSVGLYFEEEKILFSGDTLFKMGYGRTDLPGGDMTQMIHSLQRLFTLPPDTVVYPGHGEYTTIGAERR